MNEEKTIDQLVCEDVQKAIQAIFDKYPEVRSVACTIDWGLGIDAKIARPGVWQGRHGAVSEPAAIFSSIIQTQHMLDVQTQRAIDLDMYLSEHVRDLLAREEVALEVLKRLEKEVLARHEASTKSHGASE